MYIPACDAAFDDAEALAFVRAQSFGQLIAPGRARELPVVVPAQFLLLDSEPRAVLFHLARPNPLWAALEENPRMLLCVTGDWAYIPSAWKAIGDEDPSRGIPTTYYASVQLAGSCRILDSAEEKLDVLRHQLAALQPQGGHADPSVHSAKLGGIRAARFELSEIRAKFKFGGNVDAAHRHAVAQRLEARNGPGDLAARAHLLRRLRRGGSRP